MTTAFIPADTAPLAQPSTLVHASTSHRTASRRRAWPAWLALSLLAGGALAPAQAQIQVQMQAQESLQADPPGRVARLGYTDGAVSFSPAEAGDSADWSAAILNRPLTSGDRLWTAQRARSELHVGSTAVRMDSETSLDFIALDDDTTQLRLAQGTLHIRLRALYDGQRLEVNTPNLAVVLQQAGEYRIDVIPSSNVTRVVVQAGSAQVYGDNGVPFVLGNQQQSSFTGTRLAQVMLPGAERADTFDAWAADRNRLEDQSVSARYIPREVPGYQQLDNYGDWSQDAAYGAVWIPRAVPANWAPYRAGHWDWIAPWGWTWIDDAPWGFAPFHYGRWTQIGPRWAWAPGRIAPRPVYAPALVGFLGGSGLNWNIAIGGRPGPGVGWFPLGPGEAYRPHYRGSPRYIGRLNHNIAINNYNSIYRYQRFPGAVTAIRSEDFRRGRPVRGGTLVSAADLNRAQLANGMRDIPQRPGRRDGEERPRPSAGGTPPAAVIGRPVIDGRNRPPGVVGGPDRRGDDRRDDGRDEGRNGGRGSDGRSNDSRGNGDDRGNNRPGIGIGSGSGRGDDLRNWRPDGDRPGAGQPGRGGDRDGRDQGRTAAQRPDRGPTLILPPDRGVPQPERPTAVPDRPALSPDRGNAGGGSGISPAIAAQIERARQEREEARLRASQPANPGMVGQEPSGQRPQRSDPRPDADRNGAPQVDRQQQQLQREQWQQQREAQRQQQQIRQETESSGQRGLRDAAQRDFEARRQLQQQQQQQRQQQQQQPQQWQQQPQRPPQQQLRPQPPRGGGQMQVEREPQQAPRDGRPLQGMQARPDR